MASDEIRRKAVAERDLKPWRYYRFERERLMEMLDQYAERFGSLEAEARPEGEVIAEIQWCLGCEMAAQLIRHGDEGEWVCSSCLDPPIPVQLRRILAPGREGE